MPTGFALQSCKLASLIIQAETGHCAHQREAEVCSESEYKYRTGTLIGACAYISTARKYALIREMRLITNTLRVSRSTNSWN